MWKCVVCVLFCTDSQVTNEAEEAEEAEGFPWPCEMVNFFFESGQLYPTMSLWHPRFLSSLYHHQSPPGRTRCFTLHSSIPILQNQIYHDTTTWAWFSFDRPALSFHHTIWSLINFCNEKSVHMELSYSYCKKSCSKYDFMLNLESFDTSIYVKIKVCGSLRVVNVYNENVCRYATTIP